MSVLAVIVFVFLAVYLFVYNTCLSGTIKEKARVKANYVAIKSINYSIDELLLSQEFSETAFFDIQEKTDGTVASVTINTKTTNLFKTKLSQIIIDYLKEYDKETIEMAPFSSYGYSIVPFGIRIPVLVVPVEILSTDFSAKLTDSGINQTLYQLNVDVDIVIKLLLPIGSETFNVNTTVPIAQTVIVGDIPDTYTNVDGAKDTGPNTILDIAS